MASSKDVDHTPETWASATAKLSKLTLETQDDRCQRVLDMMGTSTDYNDVLITRELLVSFKHAGLPAPNSETFWIGKRIGDLVQTAKAQQQLLRLMQSGHAVTAALMAGSSRRNSNRLED